jgi:hypothetical protein
MRRQASKEFDASETLMFIAEGSSGSRPTEAAAASNGTRPTDTAAASSGSPPTEAWTLPPEWCSRGSSESRPIEVAPASTYAATQPPSPPYAKTSGWAAPSWASWSWWQTKLQWKDSWKPTSWWQSSADEGGSRPADAQSAPWSAEGGTDEPSKASQSDHGKINNSLC